MAKFAPEVLENGDFRGKASLHHQLRKRIDQQHHGSERAQDKYHVVLEGILHILEGHEHMEPLEDAGGHDHRGQEALRIHGFLLGADALPALGAICLKVWNLEIVLPMLQIGNHLVFLGDNGDGRRLIGAEVDEGAPGIHGVDAAHSAAADEFGAGIPHEEAKHLKGIVEIFRLPVRLQIFQEVFSWCQHMGIYELISSSAGIPLKQICHEGVYRLYEYDRKNNTNFIKVLLTYMECGCNGQKAAAALFIHRNTLNGYLSRISSILQAQKVENGRYGYILLSLYLADARQRGQSGFAMDYA